MRPSHEVVTFTVADLRASPQRLAFDDCWSTIPSPNIFGRVTFAIDASDVMQQMAKRIVLFIFPYFLQM